MADFRPFRGLRYRADDELGSLLAPPFDVIDEAMQAELHGRSPHNVVRLELGEQHASDSETNNRYTRAAAALEQWCRDGVIAPEDRPAFYLYMQEFQHEGARKRRSTVLGRLRLEPWSEGVILPHEETMAKPKEDRIQLMRALRANVSPVWTCARDLPDVEPWHQLFDTTTPDGQRHTLSKVDEGTAEASMISALRDQPLYILDGHHRYETALAYRDERRASSASWTGEEPENFVLAAITAQSDPGLVLLPFHRLVRPRTVPQDVVNQLGRYFQTEDVSPKSYDGTALLRLLARVSASGASGPAFGALGLEEGRLHLLTLRDGEAVRALMPERSRVWQSLDVNVFEYAVLRGTLGAPEEVDYTEDATLCMREVESGRWPLAFLLNPTRIDQMLTIADEGERMPAKSTYFYPKLATGLVLNAFD